MKPAALAQFGTQGNQHIKNHADTCQIFTREGTTALVGVHNQTVRNMRTSVVVVGYNGVDAPLPCTLYAVVAGNAVVYGQNQLRTQIMRDVCQFRGQPVAVFEAVGDKKINRRTHALQTFDADRAGGCTIGIVIGDNQDFFMLFDSLCQALGGSDAVG